MEDEASGLCVPERCGTGAWGLLLRDADTVHVAPWGEDDSDGSEAGPLRSVRAAADLAGDGGGGLVAVAAGEYGEALDLGHEHDGVRIAGRCPEMVTLGGDTEDEAALSLDGGAVRLASVTLTGAGGGLRVWTSGLGGGSAELDAEDVVLADAERFGVFASGEGAVVRLARARIEGTRPGADGSLGRGIELEYGASLTADELVVEGSHDAGLVAFDPGTTAELSDSAVIGTVPREDGTGGVGLVLLLGAGLRADGLLVDGSADAGISAAGDGSTLDLGRVTVSDTICRPDGTAGHGLRLEDGATVTATDLLVEGNRDVGVFLRDGAHALLAGSTVRGTLPRPDGSGGWGAFVASGATMTATGLLLDENTALGLVAAGLGVAVDLADSVVRATLPAPDGTAGRGIDLEDGASLVARGLLLEGNHDVGLFATGPSTTLEVEGSIVLDTLPLPDGTSGTGVEVLDEAALSARGLTVQASHAAGLIASLPGTAVDLRDSAILDTRPSPDGTGGQAIDVQLGACLVASGLEVLGNHGHGLIVSDQQSSVEIEDALIGYAPARAGWTCAKGVGGWGGASVLLRNVAIERPVCMGIHAVGEGTMIDLQDVAIREVGSLPDGSLGRGIDSCFGADVAATRLEIQGVSDFAVGATEEGTSVSAGELRISGVAGTPGTSSGFGMAAQYHGTIDIGLLTVEDSEGPGIYATSDAVMEVGEADLSGCGFAAAVLFDARLALHGGTVTGSAVHAGEGGGVGVFAWSAGGPPDLLVEDVAFSDLAGPALYLRGPGRFEMSGCEVREAGTWPWLPGGVLATEGVEAWHRVGQTEYFTGLLVEGNEFEDLPGDAVLLDGSGATLAPGPQTGMANSFSNLDGEQLVWQRCGDRPAPEILDGSMDTPACADQARSLGPLLEYRLWLEETTAVE